MTREPGLDLDVAAREEIWTRVGALLADYERGVRAQPIAPRADPHALAAAVAAYDFERPVEAGALVDAVVAALVGGQVHASNPRYFGLFQPATAHLSIVADALVAAFNPQLATRSHAAWPVAIEEHLIRAFAHRFGYAAGESEGTFTTGGAEANATAVLAALASTFPDWAKFGVRGLAGAPTLYVSTEGHPTIARAARSAGLGTDAVRVVPVDGSHRMKPSDLAQRIGADRAAGALPFMVVATAGSTSAGAIDPLPAIAAIAEKTKCWLHVDAAWGGLAAFVPELSFAIEGAARADSIAFDPHKVLATPMGAGVYLSRRRGAMARAFEQRAGYMPREADDDPYARSMQWSRRFIGLKVFLPLAAIGWDGYAQSLRRQVSLGARLRARLRENGWRVVNETVLPVVCFVDDARRDGHTAGVLASVARRVIATEGGWISMTRFASGAAALRASVNNHRTREDDVDRLVDSLDAARHELDR